jgi:polar amino acid transport system substrate-binding protein
MRDFSDVDRSGIRIAIAVKSAYDLFLSRTLQHAALVRAQGMPASYELFLAQRLDVLAGIKPWLSMMVEKLPGSHILDGHFMTVQQCIGTPRGRAAGARFLREFVVEVKRELR